MLYSFVRNNGVGGIDILGLCNEGDTQKAKCNFSVLPLGMTPGLVEARAGLGWAIGTFDTAVDSMEVVSGLVLLLIPGGVAEGVALLGQFIMGEGMQGNADMGKVGDSIAKLVDKLRGDFNGYVLYTQISYEECESCWYWMNTWAKRETDWTRHKTGGDTGKGEYVDYLGALKAARSACDSHLSSFFGE